MPIRGETERTHPEVLTLHWEKETAGEELLELSATGDFAQPECFWTSEGCFTVENLLVGQKYYWRVNGGPAHSFETKGDFPRFVRIGGVPNVRDLGGTKIKQGLLYRGGAMSGRYQITEEGKETFHSLKIKTDMDLRQEAVDRGLAVSPAGTDIQLALLPYRPYREVIEPQHMQALRRIMEFLAVEENYPVFFHCTGGADRTGMIGVYLKALAGEDEEDIHRDYEMTSLSVYANHVAEGATGLRQRTAEYYVAFLEILDSYAPGQSLQAQVRAFLRTCGVTQEQMDRIVAIITAE